MTDDTEQAEPSKPRATFSVKMPPPAEMAAVVAEQERRMTAGQRAIRDLQSGISQVPETRAEKAIREAKLGLTVPDSYFKSALPADFLSGISASVSSAVAPMVKGINASTFASMEPLIKGINASAFASMEPVFKSINASALAAMAPTIKGINASTLASMEPVFKGINASLLASTAPIFKGFDASGVASAARLAASGMLPKNFPQTLLPTSTLPAMQAASLFAKRADFEAMTDRPAGVLGRFDAAVHADSSIGAAVDRLIAAPTRRGPVGFDYGAVQRRTREVGDLLSTNPPRTDLVEVVEEAQEVTGLGDDEMDGMSVFLGVPPPQGYAGGATAARILFIATVGTVCVLSDMALKQAVTPSGVLGLVLDGAALWALLHKGAKPE